MGALIGGPIFAALVLQGFGCTEPHRGVLSAPVGLDGGATDGATAAGADAGAGAGNFDGAPTGTSPQLVIDAPAHDYGTVVVGSAGAEATFVIANQGTLASGALDVALSAGAAEFSLVSDDCSGMPLAGGASCRIVVGLTPTAAGTARATLTVSASPGGIVAADLTGTIITAGALQIAPMVQDFGMVVRSAGSGTQTFTVTNTGQESSGDVSASLSGTDAAQFAITADGCTGQALAASRTCQITVRFSPTEAGAKSASLIVSGDPGGAAVAQLSGTGITPSALGIAPGAQDFGSVQEKVAGVSKDFLVQNAGQAATGTLAVSLTGANGADFSITANTCANQVLNANATCTVTVQFAPATAGSKLANLSITGTPGGTAVAQLSGESLASAGLGITPGSKAYNSVTVGLNASATLTVTNTGGVPTGVPSLAIDGTDATQFAIPTGGNGCTAALPAGGSCTVTVRFAPTTTGLKTGTLTVSANPGGSAAASLTGTGVAAGLLGVSPNNEVFGSILQGTSGAPVTFTVTNSGGSATGALATTIVGTTDFHIVTNGCAAVTLSPAGTCALTVAFGPASAGAKSGTLQVTANPGGTATASLTGTGLAPASLAIVPTSFTFPTTIVGSTSATTAFTVTNSGGVAAGTTTVLAATIGGANAADYRLVSSTCAGTLAAGASCTVVVSFAPTSSGSRIASLSVAAMPGGTAAAALNGTAQTAAVLTLAAAAGSAPAYGSVSIGQTKDQTFAVRNSGQQTSSAITVSLTVGSGFSVLTGAAGDCVSAVTTLASGATCNVRVRFAPAATGAAAATLAVSAATGGTPAPLALTGTGLAQPSLVIAPMVATFPTTVVGSTSGGAAFTVTNPGGTAAGTTTALAVVLGGTNAADFVVTASTCGATLAAGATCVVTVAFRPAGGGARSATLNVSASPGGTATAALSGTAQTRAVLTLAAAAGSTAAFGGVLVGQTKDETFVVTNAGQQTSSAVTVSITPAGSRFSVLTGAAGDCTSAVTTLGGGATCNVRVRFAPTVAGAASASLGVSATVGGAPAPLALTGTGLAPATLTITPTSQVFPNTNVGAISPTVTFTISNVGTTTAGTTVPFSLTFPGTFGVAPSTTCTVQTLAPGASCVVSIAFAPKTAGLQTALLTASATPGGTATATMSGTGVIVTHTISVVATGAGTVRSTSAPTQAQQLSCPGTCLVPFVASSVVTLTATPTAGSVFGGWTGACAASGRTPTCVLAASVDRAVGATFVAASALATWVLNGTVDSTAARAVTTTVAGVTAGTLARSAALTPLVFASAFMADNWPAGAINTNAFFSFSVTAATSITYESVRFSLYNNFDGATAWQVRSSVDNFVAPLAQGSLAAGIAGGGAAITANVSALGNRTGTVTFRFYTFANSGTTSPLQRGFRGDMFGGTNLRVFGAAF